MVYNTIPSLRGHEWFHYRLLHGGKMEDKEKPKEKPKKKPRRRKRILPKPRFKDGMVIGVRGKGLAIIEGGKRRGVPDVPTQLDLGIGMHHVVMLHQEQFDGIPEGEPMPSILRKKRPT